MPLRHLSADQTTKPAISSRVTGRCLGSLTAGFSLLEVLVVVTILGILAGMAIPYLTATSIDQLQAVAEVIVSDIDYARNLAISNGSEYRLTLQPAQNRYQLTHSGTNTLLHALPTSPFKSPGDTVAQQTTRIDHLPIGSGYVQLLGAKRATGSTTELTELTFTALGGTSIPENTLIWLTAGQGAGRRYIAVRVNAATGIAEIDPLTGTAPTGLAALSSLR
ncbi:hypothetical protein ETAA8_38910 [Anatilimnocola aggregata]|uniref:Type II secretion system protein H n=1 Tax=Anatilimnocola aggregata TaxID=2528021 RepID=A0A517YEX1_9BACT|nr:prepilin-type N-terminal cleavage/methylation domain-containing protein [Anatilimnocola aggregata]QDU28786.1 hypothetical protein ETAA8_38910 [Anatilimnocola aggregata]